MTIKFINICVLCLFWFHYSWAQPLDSQVDKSQPIELHAIHIPHLIEDSDTGLLIELLKRIESIAQLKFDVTVLPAARIKTYFKSFKIFGYFPELEGNPVSASCRTSSFKDKFIIVISRHNQTIIERIEQLEGQSVGAVRGYSYGSEILNNNKIKLAMVKDDETNIKKLLTGRIDYMLADIDSSLPIIKRLKLENQLYFDPDKPINKVEAFFVFQPTVKGRAVCKILSDAIDKLNIKKPA